MSVVAAPGHLAELPVFPGIDRFLEHWMVHEGGWKLARSDVGRLLAIPPAYSRVRVPDTVPAA
jgi:hypothetical protein